MSYYSSSGPVSYTQSYSIAMIQTGIPRSRDIDKDHMSDIRSEDTIRKLMGIYELLDVLRREKYFTDSRPLIVSARGDSLSKFLADSLWEFEFIKQVAKHRTIDFSFCWTRFACIYPEVLDYRVIFPSRLYSDMIVENCVTNKIIYPDKNSSETWADDSYLCENLPEDNKKELTLFAKQLYVLTKI